MNIRDNMLVIQIIAGRLFAIDPMESWKEGVACAGENKEMCWLCTWFWLLSHTLGNSKWVIILRRTYGPSMSLYLTVRKRKRGWRGKRLKVFTWLASKMKRKRTAGNSSQNEKAEEQPKESTCFICKKTGHMKDCSKYTPWHEKKGLHVKSSTKWCWKIHLCGQWQ